MTNDELTISIMGEKIAADYQERDVATLRFLPNNPRIEAALREVGGFSELTYDEQQKKIYEVLLREPSVTNLIPQIRRDRGLQEPVIVRWDRREVVEGNSRLAAYRRLQELTGDEIWERIPCKVVQTLTSEQQTRLLGQAHLHGRTDWSKYARAHFCYRWVKEEGKDIAKLAELAGLGEKEIEKNVRVVQLMRSNADDELSRFSYYDVLVRNRKIAGAMAKSDQLRDVLLAQIKSGAFTAQQMRDRLPVVIDKPRVLRQYQQGSDTLEDAFDRAKISDTQQRLRRVRDGLDDIEKAHIEKLNQNEVNAIEQVVKKIQQRLTRVAKMVAARQQDIRNSKTPGGAQR